MPIRSENELYFPFSEFAGENVPRSALSRSYYCLDGRKTPQYSTCPSWNLQHGSVSNSGGAGTHHIGSTSEARPGIAYIEQKERQRTSRFLRGQVFDPILIFFDPRHLLNISNLGPKFRLMRLQKSVQGPQRHVFRFPRPQKLGGSVSFPSFRFVTGIKKHRHTTARRYK